MQFFPSSLILFLIRFIFPKKKSFLSNLGQIFSWWIGCIERNADKCHVNAFNFPANNTFPEQQGGTSALYVR